MALKEEPLDSEKESSSLQLPASSSVVEMTSTLPASSSLMSVEKEYGIPTLKSMSGTVCSLEHKSSSKNLMQQAAPTVPDAVGAGAPGPRIKTESTQDTAIPPKDSLEGESNCAPELPKNSALPPSQTPDPPLKLINGCSSSSKEHAQSGSTSAPPHATAKEAASGTANSGSADVSLGASATGSSKPPSALPAAVSPAKVEVPEATGASPGTKPSANAAIAVPPASQGTGPPSPPPPLKSVTMSHLRKKYTSELQYMLREFRKLERQLLGAKGIEESAGSRERREKLHSFILHLEDTIRQIDLGCKLEAEGKSTAMVGVSSSSVGAVASGSLDVTGPSSDEFQKKMAANSALTKLTKEKEEEENVQKLEEHILANLLPVKVRLTKQLAAQQGAARNPAGMPAARRGMLQPAEKGKGTFAAAAEQRRKQAEAVRAAQSDADSVPLVSDVNSTQFGKPLKGGGSSLTQKLHGATLGSKSRSHGHGVGSPVPASQSALTDGTSPEADEESRKRKILYAGMAPGSEQVHSSVSAAAGVHGMVIENPALLSAAAQQKEQSGATAVGSSFSAQPMTVPQHHANASVATRGSVGKERAQMGLSSKTKGIAMTSSTGPISNKRRCEDFILTDEERKKLRKKRRKKQKRREARRLEIERQRQILLQQQAVQASQLPNKGGMPPGTGKKTGKGSIAGKGAGKKKGPRTVEYICALCSEAYSSTCDFNPWWALTSHDCPKCRKTQIPRVDITSPANAIEYHPALLAHAEDTSNGNNGGGGGAGVPSSGGGMSVMHINPSHITPSLTVSAPLAGSKFSKFGTDSDSGSDFSDDSDGGPLSDDSMDTDDSDGGILQSMSPSEEAEKERFGREYTGPTLTENESARLLVLLAHASTCPGRHKSAKHRDVCHSTKFLMLHVRDCPGTTSTFDICPFPWCRKIKHLLYHLVACPRPQQCTVCSPQGLSPNLVALSGLNDFRRKKQRERMAAAMAAAAAAKSKAAAAPPKPIPSSRAGHHQKKNSVSANMTKTPQYKSWTPSGNASASAAKSLAHAVVNPVKKPVGENAVRPPATLKQPVPTPLPRTKTAAPPKPKAAVSLAKTTAQRSALAPAPPKPVPTAPKAATAPKPGATVIQPTAATPKLGAAVPQPAATAPQPPAAAAQPPATVPRPPGVSKPPVTAASRPPAANAQKAPETQPAVGGSNVRATTEKSTTPSTPAVEAPVADSNMKPITVAAVCTPLGAKPESTSNDAGELGVVANSESTSNGEKGGSVTAALLAEATPSSPPASKLGEATVSPSRVGSGDSLPVPPSNEDSPVASVTEVSKELPQRLKFPQLETTEKKAAAALIEDHGSSGQSEPENDADVVAAAKKEAVVKPEQSAAGTVVLAKSETESGVARGDAKTKLNGSTPSASSPENKEVSCSTTAEKKAEPVRIGC